MMASCCSSGVREGWLSHLAFFEGLGGLRDRLYRWATWEGLGLRQRRLESYIREVLEQERI